MPKAQQPASDAPAPMRALVGLNYIADEEYHNHLLANPADYDETRSTRVEAGEVFTPPPWVRAVLDPQGYLADPDAPYEMLDEPILNSKGYAVTCYVREEPQRNG